MSDEHVPDSIEEMVPPPWERTTEAGVPAPESFGKTQPIKSPSVEDVLEVFGHFRQDLIGQIDKRDERILLAVHDIRSMIAEHYQRETQRGDEHAKLIRDEAKRGDEHAKWLRQLRNRSHKLSTEQQALSIRLAMIEQHLGISAPAIPPATLPEPEPE